MYASTLFYITLFISKKFDIFKIIFGYPNTNFIIITNIISFDCF